MMSINPVWLSQLLHLDSDPVCNVERVGSRKLKNGKTDRGMTIEGARLIIILRAHLDASHVAQAKSRQPLMNWRRVGRIGNDLSELIGVAQSPECIHW